jgi:hypothetical protein
MVSDGHRKIFEQEGVGLIEPEAGAQFFVRELSSKDRAVEILAVAPLAARGGNGSHSILADVKSLDNVAFEKEVSLSSMPCLESHILNGKAVLPAAIMMEWLAHGAVHGNPGMSFHGCENFQVLKGLIVEPSRKIAASILAGQGQMCDGILSVPVQLISHEGGRRVLHARAEVLLSETPPAPFTGTPFPAIQHNGNGNGFLYENSRLFHGPHFHGIEKLERCSEKDIAALVKSAPSPKKWIYHPLRPSWLADPLVLDSSFQLMILWTWEYRNAASLPCAIRRFRQFTSLFPKNGGRILIRITSAQNALITADIHYCDRQGSLVAMAEGYECVVDSGLQNAFQRNRLMHEQH